MNVVTYSLMAYGLTAVISFVVIAIIVALGKLINKPNQTNEKEEE